MAAYPLVSQISNFSVESVVSEVDSQGFEDSDTESFVLPPVDVVVLTQAALEKSRTTCVNETSELLGISKATAATILLAYAWNKDNVIENFLNHPERVCKRAGVQLERPTETTTDPFTCTVCYVPTPWSDTFAHTCGHRFCIECWKSYLTQQIKDNDALFAKCMMHKCPIHIDEDVISLLGKPEDLARWRQFQLAAFVKDQRALKWCPNPASCTSVAKYAGAGKPIVRCSCNFEWCFACAHEHHAPASCENMLEWEKKNTDSGETTAWIIANTKACPKCRTQIEKNQGCNHMTCSQCRHEFCWLCRGPWSEHGSNSGGYYSCNRYAGSTTAQEDQRAEMLKSAHDRYLHYFERYHNHARSHTFATRLRATAEARCASYADQSGWNGDFFLKAADLVIKCRKALKWTYVYGYYLPDGTEKNLFENQQQDLEHHTERLTHMTEQDLSKTDPTALKNYTKVTQRYWTNLMEAWEKGQTRDV